MIENMRKYTGLMAVVFILLAAGFLFTMNDISSTGGGGMGSGPTLLEANGRILDQQEYRRMGESTLRLASEAGLHAYVNFLMVPDSAQLQQAMQLLQFGYPNYYVTMGRNLKADDYNRFISNRIIIQQAIREMGVNASEEEVSNAIKSSSGFNNQGRFDQVKYANFIEKRLGRLGMTEKDLRDVVRENLCLNKIIQIVGGGLVPPRKAAQNLLEAQMQSVRISRVVLKRNDFAAKANPSEEEIKSYWETHQDLYKTDEQRRINYILLDLPPATQIKSEPLALAPDATDEEKKSHAEAEKARLEAEATLKAQMAEKRAQEARSLQKEIDQISQEIYDSEEEKKPLDFEAILTKRNHPVQKTGLFSRSGLPKQLASLTLRGNSNQRKSLADFIFGHSTSSEDPYDLVSDALPVGEHGWIIFTLEEVVEPSLLDYESAKSMARAELIAETSSQEVKDAAIKAREAIVEAVASGQTFKQAAEQQGLTPEKIGPFSISDRDTQQKEPSYRLLHQKASGLNPGDVSETIDEKDRSLFFYLESRDIEDTEEGKRRIEAAINQGSNQIMMIAFLSWLQQQYDEADVKGLAVENQ
ncbi:MAG: SurA N-terminal domain-containing protein [Akkermansiaceae bacterium]